MARPVPFNRLGIYGIETVGAPVVTTTDVTYKFEEHPYLNAPFNGMLIVHVKTAVSSSTTGTLPVYFQTGNVRKAITKEGGVALTASDLTTTGYYLMFYDYSTGVAEIMGAID